MKKIISALIIALLLINTLPFQVVYSPKGVNFEKTDNKTYAVNKTIEYTDTFDNDEIQLAFAQIEALGDKKINIKGKLVDPKIYIMYNIVAYGGPFGDKKYPPTGGIVRTEYRYLGRDYDGNDITNDDFPNDATSDTEIQDKDYVYADSKQNSWEDIDNNIINYILFEGEAINDGEPTGLTVAQILEKEVPSGNIEELKKYAKLLEDGTFKTSSVIYLLQENGYYNTVNIEPIGNHTTLECDIETNDRDYQILPHENYVDIEVTVKTDVDLNGYASTYISKENVILSSITGDYSKTINSKKVNTSIGIYTRRIYKKDLSVGDNSLDINGCAEFKSIFPEDGDNGSNDGLMYRYDTANININVLDEELTAILEVPPTANITESYTVKDNSFVPTGATVISSKLERKIGSGSYQEIDTWNGNSMNDAFDYATKITYRLTIQTDKGDIDTDEKTIEIIDSRNVDGLADLEIPLYTYEGHPFLARDRSTFDVAGEPYTASRAYDEGIASNSIDVLSTTKEDIDRLSDTTFEITINENEFYNVELEVDIKNDTLTDVESIEVRPTPYIEEILSGTQKQNRKQVLNIDIARHPSNSITHMWVDIKDVATGEKVQLVPGSKQNSTNIKTRTMTYTVGEYYNNYNIEFLSKYDTDRTFQYKIYVRDSKGDTQTVTKNFTVKRDEPPVPVIDCQETYYRNEDSNIADIVVEDMTVSSDGDQVERTWKVAFDTDHDNNCNDEAFKDITSLGYQDLSFGTKQKVKFSKTGVGRLKLRVYLKEVWTEPTLEEYVTDSDRKTGYTYKIAYVKNISPTVNLDSVETYPVDILILTTQKDYTNAKNKSNELETKLINHNVDSHIDIRAIDNTYTGTFTNTHTKTRLAEYEFWSGKVAALDNKYYYKVIPSSTKIVSGYVRETAPFKIQAIRLDNNATAWTYTTTETDFTFKQDSEDKYLYVVCSHKTLLINKATGSLVTTLNFVVDGSIYITNDYIYMFKDHLIEKYNLSNGQISTVAKVGDSVTKQINGKVTFIGRDSANNVFRGQFDLATEKLEREPIQLTGTVEGSSSAYRCIGIDQYGTALLWQEEIDLSRNGFREFNKGKRVWVISPDNKIIKYFSFDGGSSPDAYSCGLITNEKGAATHIYYGFGNKPSSKKKSTISVFDIYSTKSATKTWETSRTWLREYIYSKHIQSQNTIHVLKEADYNYYDLSGSREVKVTLPDYSIKIAERDLWDSGEEQAFESDLYHITVMNDDEKTDGKSRIKVYRYPQSLDDVMERALLKYNHFREDTQKYVVIMDDVYEGDRTKLQGVIDKMKAEDIHFIYVGDNLNAHKGNYGDLIYQSVSGHKIEYSTNMSSNYNAIANVVNSAKDKTKYIANMKIPSSGSVRLRKYFELEPSTEYAYEYDIKYSKDYTSKNMNILSAAHTQTDGLNYGFTPKLTSPTIGHVNGSAYLEDVLFEDFNDSNIHPMLTLEGGGDYPFELKHGMYGKLDFGHSRYSRTAEGTVTFTMEKDGFVSFDYTFSTSGGSYAKQYIQFDGNTIWSLDDSGYSSGKKTLYCSKGSHRIHLYGRNDDTSSDKTRAYIDNIKIQYLNRSGSVIRDNGVAPTSKIQSVKANTTYHHKNSFKTPSAPSKLLNIPTGITATENCNDANLNSFISLSGNWEFKDGYAQYDRDTAYFYITVPDGMSATATIQGYPRYAMKLYHNDENVGSFSKRTLTTLNVPLNDGLNEFKVYTRRDYFRLHDVKINYNGLATSNGQKYFPVSQYTGTTRIDLSNSSSSAEEADISNFKLYKIIDGIRYLVFKDDFIDNTTLNKNWIVYKTGNGQLNLKKESALSEPEDITVPIYAKGELVKYNIFYDDYESDPSKKQYWKYVHEPFTDTRIPEHNQVLSAPINRFHNDGKYTLYHWQEDSTGVTSYDKVSNTARIPFYVQGESTAAPEVIYIKTIPTTVKEGQNYKIEIGVDDEDLDNLDTTIELYLNNQLIYTYTKNNVSPTGGVYPSITSGTVPTAAAGKYTIVATAKDDTGVGMGSYEFTVVSEGKIEGEVHHVDQWNINRKKYNVAKTGNEEKPRGYNVFWSGEKFVLKSKTEGKPHTVHVEIVGEGYETYLSSSDKTNWEGHIAEESMILDGNYVIVKWGRNKPETLTFKFTAHFDSGITKTHQVQIIVDHREPYWRLRRKY